MTAFDLECQAVIEEAWARRGVFSESMQAERMAAYIAKRELRRIVGLKAAWDAGYSGEPGPAVLRWAPPRRSRGRLFAIAEPMVP